MLKVIFKSNNTLVEVLLKDLIPHNFSFW
jgi:hypothetical protein